jgi:hypothetical protein
MAENGGENIERELVNFPLGAGTQENKKYFFCEKNSAPLK